MTGKGDKPRPKDLRRYNEAKYWKLKEIKKIAKHLQGEIIDNCIQITNELSRKENTEKILDVVQFVEYISEYYKVKKYTAAKGLIKIELKEK